jgi:hypothetical protein
MQQDRKPIQIDIDLHECLKKYCKDSGLVLKSLVERLITIELEKNGVCISTCKTGQE